MGGLIIEGGEQPSSAPGKTELEGTEHEVTREELEGVSFGKPGWLNSGITDYRKSTPGLKTLRPLSFLKTQVILISVTSSKTRLPQYDTFYMFNSSSTAVMGLGGLCL